ncbi:hypothetical protein Poli38472_002632 [Pythium oligandrum]|uniref:PX domain-containing protein n=1 Tax=Pythium oligandrum TaxID=41045 RepID=A0A8K1FIC9_PYTOL|nr:hypothetical protein Poli38472_002632 [Pythium oligandrum]|eukprot:TMW63691.1 hypothetical protein Poli38472_002632 [Pythium oligandrum]
MALRGWENDGLMATDEHERMSEDALPRKSEKMGWYEAEEDEDAGEDAQLQRSSTSSRLAASFLSGRERVARAARAWREVYGSGRGLLGLDDDEKEDPSASEDEEKKTESEEEEDNERRSTAQRRREDERRAVTRQIRRVLSTDDDDNDAGQASLTHIPALAPRRLVPKRISKTSELWICLDRIESIEIRSYNFKDEGVIHYVLDVYHYQEQHRIPTNRTAISGRTRRALSLEGRKPDFQIEQRYSNFASLRSKVLKATRCSSTQCAYCQRVVEYLATSKTQPCFKVKMSTTPDMRKTILSQFMMDLVRLAREQRNECALAHLQNGQYLPRMVPGIVKRFLTVQTGENFMR